MISFSLLLRCSRTVPSPEQARICSLGPMNVTLGNFPFVLSDLISAPLHCPDRQSLREIPELERAVRAAAYQQLAAAVPGDAEDVGGVAGKRLFRLAAGGAENLDHPVSAGRCEMLAVGGEFHGKDRVFVGLASERTTWPLVTFQILSSAEREAMPPPVASICPSGLKSRARTRSESSSGCSMPPSVRSGLQEVGAFQRMARLSAEIVSSVSLPSEVSQRTAAVWSA